MQRGEASLDARQSLLPAERSRQVRQFITASLGTADGQENCKAV